jgi:hypothetical protein
MPINTVQEFLRVTLQQLALPLGLGALQAYITPPNPGDGTVPTAYIWGSRGDENRLALPRARPGVLTSGGTKNLVHQVDIWVVWHGDGDNPSIDRYFPAMVDAVLAKLRNVSLSDGATHQADPTTGTLSNILDVGERMTWEYGPVRATDDQRTLRFDAQITVEIHETIQA